MLNYWHFAKYKDGTTGFYMNPCDLDKYMHQNKAQYTEMFVEGCLQDNFVLECKRGYLFCYEHFLNSWFSDLECYFIPYKLAKTNPDAYDNAFSAWYEFEMMNETE